MGVRLAMDKVLAIAEHDSSAVYTHGPIIHNRQAVELLESKGVRNLADMPDASSGTVLIRAHGVPTAEERALRERGFDIVDATCPHVLASQRHIDRHAAQGHSIVIAGDTDHAEVRGLVSHAGERCAVVSTVEQARAVDLPAPVFLVAQTTFSEALYQEIAEALRGRYPDLELVQSICRATHDRQQEVLRLAREVEAMVVVGGRHSANTTRLAKLARSAGIPTYHVETAAELDVEALAQFRVVGLTAGASTPNWVTRDVLRRLEDIGRPAPLARWMPWRLLTLLARSNLLSSAAAVALTYAACHLMRISQPPESFLLAAFCYVFAVTTLNRISRLSGDGPSIPARVAFYQRHSRPLLALSLLFCGVSLLMLLRIPAWRAAALLSVAYILGVIYSVPVVPPALRRRLGYGRLKDVPGSKDIFVGLALLCVCVVAPWLDHPTRDAGALLVASCFAFVLTFVKATTIDLGDMQEDHLLGRETLPILIGERRTRRLMVILTVGLAVVLAFSAGLGWVPSVGWLLLACPAYMLGYVLILRRSLMVSDVLCTLVTDGASLLAGFLALVWALCQS
jgi:4-hydroxy-3-methylbut-2-enyl diphosphate reductase